MRFRVVELFAGVGGFRIGLEDYPKDISRPFDVIWSNQWEPSTKTQHANKVYTARWPEAEHVGRNIEEVIESDFASIPDHDLLVGGFPCQDYSVATSLKNSKGLRGKKGVLWWSIEAILRKKGKKRPKYLMLENVDRLLKSPADQRGRDFAIMLSSLNALGYAVEWKVINAAEYGMPQKRRRVFIMAYLKGSSQYKNIKRTKPSDWLAQEGVMAAAFPVKAGCISISAGEIEGGLEVISESFNQGERLSPFKNCGLMIDGHYYTSAYKAAYTGTYETLGDKLIDLDAVPDEYFIDNKDIESAKGWRYQKGAKKIPRSNANGQTYVFSEGGMSFPDALDSPSRTIITGEGGSTPTRFKHVVCQEGRYRRLTPVELERLNMFPDNHTQLEGIRDAKRAFFMGNALVVGVVERLANQLAASMQD